MKNVKFWEWTKNGKHEEVTLPPSSDCFPCEIDFVEVISEEGIVEAKEIMKNNYCVTDGITKVGMYRYNDDIDEWVSLQQDLEELKYNWGRFYNLKENI